VLWAARERLPRQSETLDCWHGAEYISNAWGSIGDRGGAVMQKTESATCQFLKAKKWLPV